MAPWLPDGLQTNPETDTTLERMEKPSPVNIRSKARTIILIRMVHSHITGLNYNISSDCALLMNADTGKIVYAKNENVAHANASTTKIMTCILALENCKLNEKVKFSSYAASIEPSKLYANAGEVFYLKDLLYSLMLPSHNDTAVAIAEHISGSSAKFVNLMNKKAAEIGCTNTHFATPNGLDAGYCFVGLSHSAKGNTYISVVPGGSSSSKRWQDSQRLLTYAYYH